MADDQSVQFTIQNPWQCLPSIPWMIMYFGLVALVAIGLRFGAPLT